MKFISRAKRKALEEELVTLDKYSAEAKEIRGKLGWGEPDPPAPPPAPPKPKAKPAPKAKAAPKKAPAAKKPATKKKTTKK